MGGRQNGADPAGAGGGRSAFSAMWPYGRGFLLTAKPGRESRAGTRCSFPAAACGHPGVPTPRPARRERHSRSPFSFSLAFPEFSPRADTNKQSPALSLSALAGLCLFVGLKRLYFTAAISFSSQSGRGSPTGNSSPFRYSATSTKPLLLSKNLASSQ